MLFFVIDNPALRARSYRADVKPETMAMSIHRRNEVLEGR
jgi:hypothetical protein